MAHIKKLKYDIDMNDVKNSDILAVGVYEDKNDSELVKSQIKGKVGELAYDFNDDQKTLYFGLGKFDNVTPEDLRRAAGTVMTFVISNKYSSISVQCPISDNHDNYFCQAFSEGLVLGSYRFLDFFTDERGEYHLEKITMVGKCCTDASKKGATVANAVCKARNLANNPPNVSTPSRLAEFAQEVGKKGDMKVTVFDREEFTKMGMG
ncbi:MAG TPA: hypothetical protein EYQ76_01320, partial [Candidatus Marinimicrobia bacterium]|nr:hypothetical protein [Candidatus Neomarinimicrobiota bacterium]